MLALENIPIFLRKTRALEGTVLSSRVSFASDTQA